MGDPARFDVFARFIARLVPPAERMTMRVADVAAGKGGLSWALLRHGFRRITPFEPHPRAGGQVLRLGIAVRDFEPDDARHFDLVVGMHPDQATDAILAGAAAHGALAVVSPCCVKPKVWPYGGDLGWQRASHEEWQEHLVAQSAARGLALQQGRLPMTGANAVLWGGSQRQCHTGKGER